MTSVSTRVHAFVLTITLLSVLFAAQAASAEGFASCVCQMQDPKKPLYCPTVTCIDTTNGFTTTGKCLKGPGPQGCVGMGTSGKDGFGLDKVAQILGDLMGKLMQQGQGKQDGAQPPQTPGSGTASNPPTCSISASTVSSNASSTTATISWSSSGEATSASISPNVGTVSVNGSQDVTVTATTPYSMSVSGPGGTGYCSTTVIVLGGSGDQCSGLFASLYGCDGGGDDDGGGDTSTTTSTTTTDTDTDTDPPPADSSSSIIASPNAGPAPLSVTFSTYNSGHAGGAVIDFGDGTHAQAAACYAPADACVSPGQNTHTYATAGTFAVRLLRQTATSQSDCSGGCVQLGTVTVTVTGTATTSMPFATNPAYLVPGLRGDIQIFNTGGTVLVGSRDQGNNTEVAGFYGGTTFTGQAQGVVASLCRSRPWANNFLSVVLPANFFDSLCVARGYTVGNPAPAQTTQTTVTATQSQPRPIQRATTTASTSTVSAVPPKVRIWSVPAKVPLGSRASIFWTSQGVVSCLVTSPDGSFSQTTLAGGASTVALTGPTTFTISCITPEGAPVTDFVTVNLSI